MEIKKSHFGPCKNEGIICADDLIKSSSELNKLKKSTGCPDEQCVVEKKFGKHMVKKYFKPDGPITSEWLSNFDIDDVLDWFQEKYENFIHIPMQTIDFLDYENPLRNLNMCEHKGKCVGVVINTDTRFGPGKHWFALFLDMRVTPFQIEYFNSTGGTPPEQIREFCLIQKQKCEDVNKECDIIIASTIRHQLGDSECGAYSIYYINSRLTGYGPEAFGKKPIRDDMMREFRKVIFRDS